MFITDIKRVIDQVSREKGIDAEVLINTLKEAITSAARKKIGARADIEVHYDAKSGDVEVFHFKLDVLEESKGAQILLSRTHPEFLVELFKTEVPEVAEGIVTLRGAARVPGIRAKIAVSSTDSDVDPVGACVGMKGNRVQSIVQELRGEKIDIVQWSPDIARYVCNALSPAEIARVIIDEDNQSMEVIVNDEYLSIAIGKGGQNVSLACEITGWHLEVTSEEEYSKEVKAGYDSLMRLTDIGLSMAEALFKGGYSSLVDISQAEIEDIVSVSELEESKAREIIEEAKIILVQDEKDELKAQKEEAKAAEAEAEAEVEVEIEAEIEEASEQEPEEELGDDQQAEENKED